MEEVWVLNNNNYVNCFHDSNVERKLIHLIESHIALIKKNWSSIVIFCIGTNRILGDTFGPLTGTLLCELKVPCKVFGTLKNPVHALNLNEAVKCLSESDLVIAVDASLGSINGVGKLLVDLKPIMPGKGLGKKLLAVGDISVSSVVAEDLGESSLNYNSLHTTSMYIPLKCVTR